MTNPSIRQPVASTSTGLRERTAIIRYLVAGIVLLGIAVIKLVGEVQDWSTAASSGFIGDHWLPLAGTVIGLVLVVTGIVTYVRS